MYWKLDKYANPVLEGVNHVGVGYVNLNGIDKEQVKDVITTDNITFNVSNFMLLLSNHMNTSVFLDDKGVKRNLYGYSDLRDFRAVIKQFFDNVDPGLQGGRTSRKASSKWQRTKRTITTKDGVKRVLYMNASKPGDLRIRKMGLQRSGKRVARYVKP